MGHYPRRRFPNFAKPQALPDKASHLDLTNLSNPEFLRDCVNGSVFSAFDGPEPKREAIFLRSLADIKPVSDVANLFREEEKLTRLGW